MFIVVLSRSGLDETGHVWFHRNQTYFCASPAKAGNFCFSQMPTSRLI